VITTAGVGLVDGVAETAGCPSVVGAAFPGVDESPIAAMSVVRSPSSCPPQVRIVVVFYNAADAGRTDSGVIKPRRDLNAHRDTAGCGFRGMG
jgi:hypothetical protein